MGILLFRVLDIRVGVAYLGALIIRILLFRGTISSGPAIALSAEDMVDLQGEKLCSVQLRAFPKADSYLGSLVSKF